MSTLREILRDTHEDWPVFLVIILLGGLLGFALLNPQRQAAEKYCLEQWQAEAVRLSGNWYCKIQRKGNTILAKVEGK